jgi:signal transduction histidine kinase
MKERARLARDLHDRLGGNLSAVKLELKSQRESMENIFDKLDNCIEDIRRVSHDLMPVSLQRGMKAALEDFAAQFSQVHFHFFGEERRIDEMKEYVVYCCASELVNNSLRHSGAKNINLQLVQIEKYVTLTVQDDGCGFDEQTVVKGIGLKNIRDRVISSNGKMDVVTAPGRGTETTIEIINN